MIDFCANCINELKRLPHSSGSQGFTGWNKFSPAFNGESSLSLTANINDALDDAGLYLFTFESIYDDEDEEYIGLKCVENGCEIYGNKHIMSIERALHFNYNDIDYVATTGVDTNVEIMSEGMDYNLIYHLPGHTKGITSMCIVDERTIYTGHYSGEVCRWSKTNHVNMWKCRIVSNPHSDKWVWIVKNFRQNEQNYIIAGSYDHNISITDAKSGKYTILSGCKGRVKTFDFIKNSIVAAYDYKENGVNKNELVLFKDVDFASGKCKSIKRINAPGMIRCVYCFNNYIYAIINRDSQSYIYQITNSSFNKGTSKRIFDSSIFHTVINTRKGKVNIRAFDAILLKNGKKVFACGGDIGTFYADVWSGNQKATFDKIPAENPITTNRIDINGISALKLVEFDDNVYMFAASYNGGIYTYEISVLENTINTSFISLCTHGDQVLDVQYLPEAKEIYVSLLSGEVVSYDVNKLIRKGQYTLTDDSDLLFKAVPGLHIVGVDLSNNQNNMSKDFKAIVKYYTK